MSKNGKFDTCGKNLSDTSFRRACSKHLNACHVESKVVTSQQCPLKVIFDNITECTNKTMNAINK